jgi:adenosine kinase
MILVTGSLAFDYLMDYHGNFQDQLVANSLQNLSVSFMTNNFRKYQGGTAGNIAYNLKLLGESPLLIATAGYDFEDYMTALNWHSIPTQNITVLEDEITASAFITSDLKGHQITMFHPGAMAKAAQRSLEPFKEKIKLAVIAPEMKETMLYYVQECQKYDVPYLFDPGQNISLFTAEEFKMATRKAKGVIFNAYEWQIFSKKTGLTKKELINNLELLIITQGDRGSKIYNATETIDIPAISPHEIQDPTGCGDAYRAGLLKGLLHKKSLSETGEIASLAATYCIEEHGSQNHKFSLEEFEKRLKKTPNLPPRPENK